MCEFKQRICAEHDGVCMPKNVMDENDKMIWKTTEIVVGDKCDHFNNFTHSVNAKLYL